MRRLIYAPRAYVFIRSENMGGVIYDVSGDVVSGSVTRNVNDLSKAEVTLRNRFFKWIVDAKTKRQIFLPNDLITIWLQRIAGKPIQVFTGYLDSVPYYQMYPGNCLIKASCTLKKLAFSWFDPGLQFFRNWVQNVQGWVVDPATGEAFDSTLNAKGGFGGTVTADIGVKPKNKITDGGFARLLFEFLTTIAGWHPNDVLVSNLPIDIGARAAKLYSQVEESTQTDQQILADYLRQIMGVHFTAENAMRMDGTITPQAEKLTGIIRKHAGRAGIPPRVMVFAALILSAFDAHKYVPDWDDRNWGIGLFSFRPRVIGSSQGIDIGQIDGFDADEIMNADIASNVMAARLNRVVQRRYSGPHGAAAEKNFKRQAEKDWKKAFEWIQDAIGYRVPLRDGAGNAIKLDDEWTRAKQYIEAETTGRAKSPDNTTVTKFVPLHVTWTAEELHNILDAREKRTATVSYAGKGAYQNLAPFAWKAKHQNDKIRLIWKQGQSKEEIVLWAPTEEAGLQYFNSFKGHEEVAAIRYNSYNHGVQTLMKGQATSVRANWPGTSATSALSDGQIAIRITKDMAYPKWASPKAEKLVVVSDPTRENQPQQGFSFQQLGQISLNSAFVAQFAFPSNIIESHALTGHKALMNDVSCLDGVRQFCQASLRNFMSLPDGRFLAFYPDYFGSKRGPYWWIDDIEIINLGIQLTDDTLATHVYTVGDSGYQNDMLSNILTRGVVSIAQPFVLDSFIEGYKKEQGPLGKMRDAYAFLQHYGARPHKETIPIIRNSWYEFLMSWQRFMQLWASQFATTVDFTFQPEVMAGGIVGFPRHNLQVYIESVTHTFDYTTGFQTTAVISSPAQIKRKGKEKHPGFALAGNINTVGASAV